MAMDGERWLSAKARRAACPADLPAPDGRRGAAGRLARRFQAASGWEAVTLLLEAGARTLSLFAAQAPVARMSPERVEALVRGDAPPRSAR